MVESHIIIKLVSCDVGLDDSKMLTKHLENMYMQCNIPSFFFIFYGTFTLRSNGLMLKISDVSNKMYMQCTLILIF